MSSKLKSLSEKMKLYAEQGASAHKVVPVTPFAEKAELKPPVVNDKKTEGGKPKTTIPPEKEKVPETEAGAGSKPGVTDTNKEDKIAHKIKLPAGYIQYTCYLSQEQKLAVKKHALTKEIDIYEVLEGAIVNFTKKVAPVTNKDMILSKLTTYNKVIKLEKVSTYIKPENKKAVKLLALEYNDSCDYQVVQLAFDIFLGRVSLT